MKFEIFFFFLFELKRKRCLRVELKWLHCSKKIFQWKCIPMKTVCSFILNELTWIASRSKIRTNIEPTVIPSCECTLWSNQHIATVPIIHILATRSTCFQLVLRCLVRWWHFSINQSTSRVVSSHLQLHCWFQFQGMCFLCLFKTIIKTETTAHLKFEQLAPVVYNNWLWAGTLDSNFLWIRHLNPPLSLSKML